LCENVSEGNVEARSKADSATKVDIQEPGSTAPPLRLIKDLPSEKLKETTTTTWLNQNFRKKGIAAKLGSQLVSAAETPLYFGRKK
jgi:hypothetical protein